jgi:D-alanine-D-alanine ligase
MRVLVLHSDIPADAPPDELDTLVTAKAVAEALATRGHHVSLVAFVPEPSALLASITTARAEVVFNLVESVYADGALAGTGPAMLEKAGIRYTGSGAACISLAADKVLSKQILRSTGLSTADWAEPPFWDGLVPDRRYVVKSVTEDASLGLDDGAVVVGAAVRARAKTSQERHGGRWFAEAYLDGREFNVSLLAEENAVRVLPIPEMRFEAWDEGRPRIVGYAAKWDEDSDDAKKTVRVFGIEDEQPALASVLAELALRTWHLFGMQGYARVDFRIDSGGAPMILEANPNPCLEPHAGFAAAAARAGLSYDELVERILRNAHRR